MFGPFLQAGTNLLMDIIACEEVDAEFKCGTTVIPFKLIPAGCNLQLDQMSKITLKAQQACFYIREESLPSCKLVPNSRICWDTCEYRVDKEQPPSDMIPKQLYSIVVCLSQNTSKTS